MDKESQSQNNTQHSGHTDDIEKLADTKDLQVSDMVSEPSNGNTKEAKGTSDHAPPPPPFSIFSDREKTAIAILVSFMAMISPISASIYLPAIPEISKDLKVSVSLVNLTITTYMVCTHPSPTQVAINRGLTLILKIFQGLAPSVIGNLSDVHGRRIAYMVCCVVYLAANIGLALNHSYAGLIVLRCVQSCGSAATVALGSATVADMVTRAERGKYIGYAGMGITLGPALGPVAGGLITNRWGWQALFWFLAALSGLLFSLILVFLPETGRSVVGNGSIPVPWWNMSLVGILRQRKSKTALTYTDTKRPPKKRVNPFSALLILRQPGPGIILAFGSLLYAGYFAILTTLSNELATKFHFNSIIIGVCFLPVAVGNILTRWTIGKVIDWNFRRHAALANYEIVKNQQQDMSKMNIERARLEVSIPMVYISSIAIVAYGWTVQSTSSLAGIEVTLFICGLCFQGALNGFNVLVVDLNPQQAATATAANNLFRCLVSAGAVALATPMIEKIGMGWMSVFIAGVWVTFSPLMWMVMLYGYKWRRDKMSDEEQD